MNHISRVCPTLATNQRKVIAGTPSITASCGSFGQATHFDDADIFQPLPVPRSRDGSVGGRLSRIGGRNPLCLFPIVAASDALLLGPSRQWRVTTGAPSSSGTRGSLILSKLDGWRGAHACSLKAAHEAHNMRMRIRAPHYGALSFGRLGGGFLITIVSPFSRSRTATSIFGFRDFRSCAESIATALTSRYERGLPPTAIS
jgi:hypothetical protein